MRLIQPMADTILAQRGHMIGWVPVCLAIGIGIYFSLRFEPASAQLTIVALVSAMSFVACRFLPTAGQPMALVLALVAGGVLIAAQRTAHVTGPVLDFRYYGPIEGRIVGMDRSFSDAPRLTLADIRLDGVAPDATPHRVRIALHGEPSHFPIKPGQRVMTTGHLSPPSGPAEPGGFDFQRHAWFLQIGAVGYTRNPLLRSAPATAADWPTWIFGIRMRLSSAVQVALPGDTGAVAAAVTTGDRSAIGQDTLADLRATNLAHLLAISGLHMGLLTAFVFSTLRTVMMCLPALGLRLPVKKMAAAGALLVAAGYLLLSGGNVATERAFVMVAVMLIAIICDRPALTLRAVAIAATIILIVQPEALLGPGFQMSFAATTALVAVFQWIRHWRHDYIPKWFQGVYSLFIASFIAGLATAPIAAFHFNQFAHYGLVANLLSVPAMGTVVMPAAVVAGCLAPFGLAWVGLAVMGWGLDWILWVARTVAAFPGSLGHVPTPDTAVLTWIACGALCGILWQGRLRFVGVPIIVMGFSQWLAAERPAILIADSGGLIGVMTETGRALNRPKGDGFAARVWLENDGAPVDQAEAAERGGLQRYGRVSQVVLHDLSVVQVSGKTALADLTGCDGADILISNQSVETAYPCLIIDRDLLRATGALALKVGPDGAVDLTSARDVIGNRPWNREPEAKIMEALHDHLAGKSVVAEVGARPQL